MTIFDLQKATKACRERTGNDAISTRARSGRIQVVHVTYPNKRSSVVTPISEWLTLDQAVEHLNGIRRP